jgi:hypothetical protein
LKNKVSSFRLKENLYPVSGWLARSGHPDFFLGLSLTPAGKPKVHYLFPLVKFSQSQAQIQKKFTK